MEQKQLILATRKSPLALVQAELAAAHLREAMQHREVELLHVTTTGDRRKSWSLEERGGKGLFTKELEEALLQGAADLAVHSAKDIPTEETPGLVLAGFLPRESPRDALVVGAMVSDPRAIATGSPRRRSQAKSLFPKACWCDIRGNVETRLRKIVGGHADATIMAEAGLRRLGLESYEGLRLRPLTFEEMVPAAGQGAIALQCREEDKDRFQSLLCLKTGKAVTIERGLLALLGGGCHTAVGVHYDGELLHVFHESIGRVVAPFAFGSGENRALVEKLERFGMKHLEGLL